jgi:antitoxin component YwqK of YwqJK toxin-antitoxin module
VRVGKWLFYDGNGLLEAEGNYEADEMVGMWRFYEAGKFVRMQNMDLQDMNDD